MIRLVACDIDGTLLRGTQTRLQPALLRQIPRILEKGIYFCPTSGRQYSSICRLFAPYAPQLHCICENGAVVYGPGAPGPVLSKTIMPQPYALQLCHDILSVDRCELLISGANTSYLCPKTDAFVRHMTDFVGNNVALVSAPEEVPEEMVKISAYCTEDLQQLTDVLGKKWQAHFHAAIAGDCWLDFTLANKGLGLRHLCSRLNIDLSEVMAFGDNYNDLPMLELVGHPYLVSQAAPALLEKIPNHCEQVEDVLQCL